MFISSVMAELGEERAAAANGVRSLGAKPVMFEEFGGRDADPLDAYLGEVETSQIYVGILGQSYGRPLPTRFSATHTEFRHAEQQGLRMAVWALATQHREGPQQSFLDEVRTFHVGPLRSALLRISSGRLASGFAVSRRKILPRGPSWAPLCSGPPRSCTPETRLPLRRVSKAMT